MSSSSRREITWVVVASLCASVSAFAACGSESTGVDPNEGASSSTSSGGKASSSSSSGGESTSSSSSGGSSSSSGSTTDGSTTPGTPIPTEANLKIAFIGDTASGSNFKDVLKLIKDEGAKGILIQGDLLYLPNILAQSWFSTIDGLVNNSTVTIPYFVARGNHDWDWNTLGSGMKSRMTTWGVTPDHNDATAINYAFDFKGLRVVMVAPDETTNPSRADYAQQRLANDSHIWKICSWHKNMRASNAGPKGDEMGWAIYENCRNAGAIVAQGHSHTYSRSKTLTDDQKQTVDPSCSDANELCVGPGKNFFFDSSLGGVDTRPLDSNASAPYWASTFTGDYGALFIEFNVDGDPKKARGYFKTIGGDIIDPAPASGKTSFTITRSP